MKCVGLIGGMSWESTAIYYRLINQHVGRKLGGLHSAKLLLWSFDFAEIADLQRSGEWINAGKQLVLAGHALCQAGADYLALCTNTMHKLAPMLEEECPVPLLHIADATANAIASRSFTKVGLLATRFTMEQDFYTGRLKTLHGIETLVPEADDRDMMHRIIYDELCCGIISEDSRIRVLCMMESLHQNGAEAIILGCTEISLLITEQDTSLPLFDTTAIHALACGEAILSGMR